MTDDIPAALRALVRERGKWRCEYCLLHEDDSWEPHQPDHVIARKHRGETTAKNLAWTCAVCNRHKGSDLASIDERTGRIVRLFQPCQDHWNRHFQLDGGRIPPRTAIGRVTTFLLQLNRADRVRNRQILSEKGLFPR